MTAGRLYCIQSWNNASETSGEQIGNRLAQSRGLHFNRDGSANVDLYSEGEDTSKRKTSIPLRQRILPQEARLTNLDTQIEELNQEYNSNRMSYGEYAQLKTILDKKRARAWELYVKAGGVVQESIEEADSIGESAYEINYSHSTNSVCGVSIIDGLSDENCLKVFLQKACTTAKTLVKWCQRAKAYYQTLKEV